MTMTQLTFTCIIIFYGTDVPVWSKLETGRIPQPGEIFQIIENQMKFKSDGVK